mmetsp:Transcript_6416/g.17941  ORF Transcript_6416/g.17941 Transcript_6416/m.17941 type:complete len:139 (-) Transcript_6416:134-550(-)|eukprot:CAMPEP_0117652814 /NCGR_PEP_ID=MMETSP0804-20121206/2838_1 /TAXON_ID=1074897 /ORGANISM="Tetraselmis astigmatica, Strain CCMP880" /LENGTH=138 /DNA_ID=CAMNT_0005458907 /DNA_START=284 /DNA_END=700 /DNA_ORIENTATION=+
MAGKGRFSGKLLEMKFMKRAQEKKLMATAVKRKRKDDEEAHWVAKREAGQSKRCVVVSEGDPPPGALLGRFSFQSFSASTQKLQEEAEQNLARLTAAQTEEADDLVGNGETSVSDMDMAQAAAKRQKTSAEAGRLGER